MKRVRVKICGIATPDALDAAVEAGVDAVGLVMSPSPREVSLAAARELIGRLPPWVASVVVTRQPPPGFAREVLTELAPSWWQSDRADLTNRRIPAGTRAVAVIREGEDTGALPPWFVYEGVQSGQGARVDWIMAAALARRGRMILAGGLDPANVAEAIRRVRPYAVDVSSGVESSRGVKDAARINAFVAAVRRAETEMEQAW